jgi:hypothetical protein
MNDRLSQGLPGGYTPESWEYARAFASSLGKFPSTFTSVIRLLVSDYDKNSDAVTDYGRFFAGRLLRSQAIQAIYWGATNEFRPNRIPPPDQSFEAKEFVDAFSGYEHSVLFGMTFIVKFGQRFCDPELFNLILPRLGRSISIGWCIGDAVPAVSPGNGVLATSFRVLGLIPFIKHDPDYFREYWRHLLQNRVPIDPDFEFSRWRCNSLQVAALMCQQLGFGLERAVHLMRALTTTSPILPNDQLESAFRVSDLWMKTLLEGRSTPTVPLPPRYYPNRAALEELMNRYQVIIGRREPHWITATREMLTPQTAPQLFLASRQRAVSSEQPPADSDVPEDLQDAIPDDTLTELSQRLLHDVMASEDE